MSALESCRSQIRTSAFNKLSRAASYIIIGVLLTAHSLSAQTLDYGTFSGYGIGMGILGNDYTTPLAACITGTQTELPASVAGFRASIVYNSDEYKLALHIDQQAEASFLKIGGGGDEIHFGRETGSSGSSFDIIVEAYGEHPAKTIDNVKWDDRYQAMLNSGDPVQKRQVRLDCGDRYIKTVFYETRLFAVLHVSSQQNSALTQFSGKAHGNVNLDIASASGSLGGDLNISSAHRTGAITVDVYSEGLGGVVPTAGALNIAAGDGLQDIATKLATYIHTLTDTGQPVKYKLAPLPGRDSGDLTNSVIFDHLNDLKQRYEAANTRLENIHALLTATDPRRLIFRQPQADLSLKAQENQLTAYIANVADAHDHCRKAMSLSFCSTIAESVLALPMSSVELVPIAPPIVWQFVIAIDGVPIAPGQYEQLYPVPGKTLLDLARKLKSNASNVDILAPILNGDYLSSITIPIRTITSATQPPSTVGSLILPVQALTLPKYWKGPIVIPIFGTINSYLPSPSVLEHPPVLHVIHADTNNPCTVVSSADMQSWDNKCLTPVGQALKNAVLANAASNANNTPPIGNINQDYPWAASDCFGNITLATSPYMMTAAGYLAFRPASDIPPTFDYFAFTPAASNQLAAKISIALPLRGNTNPGSYTPIFQMFGGTETHDRPTWAKLAQDRLTALGASKDLDVQGPNSCMPRIP